MNKKELVSHLETMGIKVIKNRVSRNDIQFVLAKSIDPGLRLLGKEANKKWLENNSEIYSFDYDNERIGLIWPLKETTMSDLKKELKADGIAFEETDISWE